MSAATERPPTKSQQQGAQASRLLSAPRFSDRLRAAANNKERRRPACFLPSLRYGDAGYGQHNKERRRPACFLPAANVQRKSSGSGRALAGGTPALLVTRSLSPFVFWCGRLQEAGETPALLVCASCLRFLFLLVYVCDCSRQRALLHFQSAGVAHRPALTGLCSM